MKGMKYDLKFKVGKNHYENHTNLGMSALCSKIKELLIEHYEVEMKITNQKVYNIMNRPHTASRLLKAIVGVNKCSKDPIHIEGDEDTT